MKPFLKGFLSVVGALGQSATSIAAESSTAPANNDSFLTKLGQPSPRSSVRTGQSEVRFSQNELDYFYSKFVVDEGAGVAKITVERSCGDKELPIASVSYRTTSSYYYESATEKVDYSPTYGGTLRWEIFECGPKTFSVPIIEDSESEFSETLGLTLSNAQGMTIAPSGGYSNLTILDNDVNPQETSLSFSSENYTGIESSGIGAILVKREGCAPHSPAISAELIVKPNTADTTDYSISPTFPLDENGNYILNWGEVRYLSDCNKSFYVYSKNDALIEGTEDFEMILSNPSEGAIIGQGNAVLNIIDNDGSTIGFSQYNYQPDENKQGVILTIERKNCVEGYIPKTSLENLSSGFSSRFSGHYTSDPDQLIWQENECGFKNIEVKPVIEINPVYIGYYGNSFITIPKNVTPFQTDFNIKDSTQYKNDIKGDTSVHFDQSFYPLYVIENSEFATIGVERDGCDDDTNISKISIDYRTRYVYWYNSDYYPAFSDSSSGTQDYIDTSGTLTWQENECGTKNFTVSILDDSAPENTEIVDISFGGHYYDSEVLFIIDDDVPTNNTLAHHDVFKEFLYLNDNYTLYPMDLTAPLTSVSSNPNIVTVDDIITARAINVGQATVTTTDVMGNSVKRIITVLPEEFAALTFYSSDEVKVGEALEVRVTASYKNPDPEQLLDLWVFIESPNLDRRLYVTSSDYLSSLFSYDPQPVRINLEKMNNTYPVFRFGVTSAMAGKYTLYAMLAKQGENPLVNTQAQMSNLARATVTLLKE